MIAFVEFPVDALDALRSAFSAISPASPISRTFVPLQGEEALPVVECRLIQHISGFVPPPPQLVEHADRKFSGVISAIEPLVDSKTRNFKIRARFNNADEALRPGLFARASIGLANTASVVTIPQTSVSYNPYGNSVYVIQSVKGKSADGKVSDELVVRRRFIKTGETRGDLVVVTDGLKAGEQVATSGLLKLQNDSKVKINNTVQPSASATPTPTDS